MTDLTQDWKDGKLKGLVFKKVKNEIWYAEYDIEFNGKYKGFIYKCRREYNKGKR